MAIDILNIEPHKVSRDLTGYLTYIYGQPKVGKTTLTTRGRKTLLVAFEKGYNALPGVKPIDIKNWTEMRQLVKELKKPAAKEMYDTLTIDTVDIAAKHCEKWICAQREVESIGKVPFGQGWNMMKDEFESVFREIAQAGYAVFFISHSKEKTFKRKDGTEYNQIVPSCPPTFNEKLSGMVDIYAYAEKYVDEDGESKVRLVLRSPDDTIETGSRFKYIQPFCDMTYESLAEAVVMAIDKEAEEYNNEFVTDEKLLPPEKEEVKYVHKDLVNEFNRLTEKIMESAGANEDLQAEYGSVIKHITSTVFQSNKSVNASTIAQAPLVAEIIATLKEEFKTLLGE